jgi:hypothetical protein
MNRRIRFLGVAICVVTTVCVGSAVARDDAGTVFSALPVRYEASTDPQVQQDYLYDFIWRSFIALNWPNVPLEIEGSRIVSGERGKPDASRPLSVMSGLDALPQTVWETYKAPFEVFPLQGNEPKAWNSVRPAPPGLAVKLDGARTLLAYPIEPTGYATDANQPYFYPHVTGPLYDQDNGLVRYEVAVNRSFLAYVRHFRYYNAAEQIAAVKNYLAGRRDHTAFQRPPFGNPDEIARYLYELPAYAQVGLVRHYVALAHDPRRAAGDNPDPVQARGWGHGGRACDECVDEQARGAGRADGRSAPGAETAGRGAGPS